MAPNTLGETISSALQQAGGIPVGGTKVLGQSQSAQDAVATLSDQLQKMTSFLPEWAYPGMQFLADNPLAGAALVWLLFWLLAFAVRILVLGNLQRLAHRTDTPLDDSLFIHLGQPLFATILLFGLMLAVNVAQLPFGTELFLRVLASCIVVSWMLGASRLSGDVLSYLNTRQDFTWVQSRTIPAIELIVKLGCILIGSYALLLVWGINPVGWMASAGIVGIAVGFAARDTLANLFAGFFIVADTPYKIGDYINLDSGERGKITHIGLRSTRLLTRDDIEITVPNGVMGNAKITNESGGHHRKLRIRAPVGVAYGTDLERVINILERIAVSHPQTCHEPAPRVRLRAFGASSQDFELLCWIENAEERGQVIHELLLAINTEFQEAGISIPFPQADIHIKQNPNDGG